MKTGIYVMSAAVLLCVAGVVALYCLRRKRKAIAQPQAETVEERFVAEWTSVLQEDARVFNGILSGLLRIREGKAKRPEKTLREWCQRTHNKWENEAVDKLCEEHLVPLIEAADREALTKWACLLLEAAKAAGITMEAEATLVLTESSAEAYIEWEGNELYPEDEVEIISPAWYQNGKVLEQGQCRKVSTEAE